MNQKCGKLCSWLGTTINFCQDIAHRLSCIFLQNNLFLRIWYKTSSNHFSLFELKKGTHLQRIEYEQHTRMTTYAYDKTQTKNSTYVIGDSFPVAFVRGFHVGNSFNICRLKWSEVRWKFWSNGRTGERKEVGTIDKEKGFLHNGHNEEQSNINIHINQLNLLS